MSAACKYLHRDKAIREHNWREHGRRREMARGSTYPRLEMQIECA